MRVVTNDELIRKNKRRATWLFFLSLGILILGFFFANGSLFGLVPEAILTSGIYALVMPLVLLFGFGFTLASVRMTNLWVRMPRPEDKIPDGLKGVGRKAVLYNYHHLPVRHVLITQQGIFPIITRFQDGKFSIKQEKWKAHKGPIGTLFTLFRLDGIGNPPREANAAKEYIQYLIEDYDDTLPIYPVVVFVDPRAKLLEIEEPTVPVVYADSKQSPNLKEFVQSKGDKPIEQFRGEEYSNFLDEWEDFTLAYA
jgi:hypothetical protein